MWINQGNSAQISDKQCRLEGIKVDPPSKIFTKLANKNTIKPQKDVPYPKSFQNPLKPSPQKFGKNLTDPPPGFSSCVHL